MFNLWQLQYEDEISSPRKFRLLPKGWQRRAWTYHLINWTITRHGLFPTYYRFFRVQPLKRMCPCCTSQRLASIEHILVKWVGTQVLRNRLHRKFSPTSVRYYTVASDMRNSLEAFPHRNWASPLENDINGSIFSIGLGWMFERSIFEDTKTEDWKWTSPRF